jgi:hypothetical protein
MVQFSLIVIVWNLDDPWQPLAFYYCCLIMNSITKENTFVHFCLTHVVLNIVEIIGGCVA